MSQASQRILALDIGTVRTGIAIADTATKIAIPYRAISSQDVDLQQHIKQIIQDESINGIVVGLPRNQSGETTKQTDFVNRIANDLRTLGVAIFFQDESLTSVIAEDRLQARGGKYTRADIDIEAATIILQDFLESNQL